MHDMSDTELKINPCPLCLNITGNRWMGPFWKRNMVHCLACGLISVPEDDWMSIDDEKARYDRHTNLNSDQGYLDFLNEVAQTVKTIPLSGTVMLDFGSGPHAVLAEILTGSGYRCDAYDPLYDRHIELKPLRYDLIIACEVIEHVRSIRDELIRIGTLCRTGGYILFRTEFTDGVPDFSRWHYMNDETHIRFFSAKTWMTVAHLLDMPLAWTAKNHFACFGPANRKAR